MAEVPGSEQSNLVWDRADIERLNKQPVNVCGLYQAVAMPTKAAIKDGSATDYAVVLLRDGTYVYLGSYNSPEAVRSSAERAEFDGREVQVTGIIHRKMPTTGQGPIAPSVNDIKKIELLQIPR